MAIAHDKLVEQLKQLETQRDQLTDTFRQLVGAIQAVTYLISESQKDEADKPKAAEPSVPFPTVGASTEINTPADVPQPTEN